MLNVYHRVQHQARVSLPVDSSGFPRKRYSVLVLLPKCWRQASGWTYPYAIPAGTLPCITGRYKD